MNVSHCTNSVWYPVPSQYSHKIKDGQQSCYWIWTNSILEFYKRESRLRSNQIPNHAPHPSRKELVLRTKHWSHRISANKLHSSILVLQGGSMRSTYSIAFQIPQELGCRAPEWKRIKVNKMMHWCTHPTSSVHWCLTKINTSKGFQSYNFKFAGYAHLTVHEFV